MTYLQMMIQGFCCKNPYEKLIRYNNALQIILLQVIFSWMLIRMLFLSEILQFRERGRLHGFITPSASVGLQGCQELRRSNPLDHLMINPSTYISKHLPDKYQICKNLLNIDARWVLPQGKQIFDIYFFVYLFLRQKVDRPTPKHRRWLTTWRVFWSSREEIS